MINRRDSRKRLKLKNPIKGDLSIYKFAGKRLPQKTSLIEVNNISINGIQFLSSLKFPIDSRIKLFFRLQLLGQTHDLYGVIVWKKQIEENKYQYGVKLNKTQIGYIKSVLSLTGELNHENIGNLIDVS